MTDCDPHEWSFKERDSFNFDWDTSRSDEFIVIEKCGICGKERDSTYRLTKVNGELI